MRSACGYCASGRAGSQDQLRSACLVPLWARGWMIHSPHMIHQSTDRVKPPLLRQVLGVGQCQSLEQRRLAARKLLSMTGHGCARLHCSRFARQATLESGQSTQVEAPRGSPLSPLLPVLCTHGTHGLTVDLDFDNRSLCRLLYQLRVFGPGGY